MSAQPETTTSTTPGEAPDGDTAMDRRTVLRAAGVGGAGVAGAAALAACGGSTHPDHERRSLHHDVRVDDLVGVLDLVLGARRARRRRVRRRPPRRAAPRSRPRTFRWAVA